MAAKRTVNAGPKPKLGQNFLVDQSASQRIVDALGDIQRRMVVEIGPGKGAITGLLAKKAQKVIAIEFDRQLAAGLSMEFMTRKNVEVIEADILAVDLETVVRGALHGVTDFTDAKRPTADVVGNLPYYITSDILLRLFRFHTNFRTMVIMVQREVADRVAAEPKTRDYGVLTVTAQLYARVENLFTLPPEAFAPPPKVHSSVLRFTIAPRFAELKVEPEPFVSFVKLAFGQKRKTLVNNLKGQFTPTVVKQALEAAKVRTDARAEMLSVSELAKVYRGIK